MRTGRKPERPILSLRPRGPRNEWQLVGYESFLCDPPQAVRHGLGALVTKVISKWRLGAGLATLIAAMIVLVNFAGPIVAKKSIEVGVEHFWGLVGGWFGETSPPSAATPPSSEGMAGPAIPAQQVRFVAVTPEKCGPDNYLTIEFAAEQPPIGYTYWALARADDRLRWYPSAQPRPTGSGTYRVEIVTGSNSYYYVGIFLLRIDAAAEIEEYIKLRKGDGLWARGIQEVPRPNLQPLEDRFPGPCHESK
jgi:hypothetical protein